MPALSLGGERSRRGVAGGQAGGESSDSAGPWISDVQPPELCENTSTV